MKTTMEKRREAFTKSYGLYFEEGYKVHDEMGITFIIGTHKYRKKAAIAAKTARAKKPFIYSLYVSEESRDKAVENIIANAKSNEAEKKKRAAEKKKAPEFEVGDIFATSWGYDETHYTFFECVEKPSPHFGIFKVIGREVVEEGSGCHWKVKPVPGSEPAVNWKFKGKPVRRKVINSESGPYVNFDSVMSYARKWDGERTYSETHPMWGR